MESTELFERARLLDALADDVETCVDTARQVASTPEWECANADDVRGALDLWRGRARTGAENLRAEASRVRGDARRAAEREQEAQEQRAGSAPPSAW